MGRSKIVLVTLIVLIACYVAFVVWSFFFYITYVAQRTAHYESLGFSGDQIVLKGYMEFWYAQGAFDIFGVIVLIVIILAELKVRPINVLMLMLTLTAIYTGMLYATYNTGRSYWAGTYYLATYYEGVPIEWCYPRDLGIIQISERDATSLGVSIPGELDPGDLETTRPIFNYMDSFYQIQSGELLWDAGLPEYVIRGFGNFVLLGVIALVAGWFFTGKLFLKGRKTE